MAEHNDDFGDLDWGGLGHNPLLDDDVVMADLFRPLDASPPHEPGRDQFGAPAATASLPQQLPGQPAPPPPLGPPPRRKRRAAPKPQHYKVVSFSLYQEDIDRLDALVKELKQRGYSKASKSQLVRFALATVDIDKLPRSY